MNFVNMTFDEILILFVEWLWILTSIFLAYLILLLSAWIGSRGKTSYLALVTYKELRKFPFLICLLLSFNILVRISSINDQYQDTYIYVFTLLNLLFLVLVARLVNRIVTRYFNHLAYVSEDQNTSSFYKYIAILVRLSVWMVGLMLTFAFVGLDLSSLLAFLGFTSLGLSFALRNTIKDVLNSFIIVFGKPFKPGDFIKSGSDVYGQVKQISLKSTLIEAPDKSIIVVPNSQLMDKSFHNLRSRINARLEYDLIVETSKLSRYERKLQLITKDISKISTDIATNSVQLILNNLSDTSHSYKLTLRVRVDDRANLDDLNRQIMHSVFKMFKGKGIEVKSISLLNKDFEK